MTEMLFRDDAYLKSGSGIVKNITEEGGIVLDQTIFYPNSGGQPGDIGELIYSNNKVCPIENTIKEKPTKFLFKLVMIFFLFYQIFLGV